MTGYVVGQNVRHKKRGHNAGNWWVYKSRERFETQPCHPAYLSWAIFLERPVRRQIDPIACRQLLRNGRQTSAWKSHSLHAGSLVGFEIKFNVGCEHDLIGFGELARP